MSLSFKQLFALLFISTLMLFAASFVFAWTGPAVSPPGGNVSAPINVGSVAQVKDGSIGMNALAVFGTSYIQDKLGIGRVSPVVALDVNGTLRLGDGGEQCQAVSAGAVRYVSSLSALQYCDGSAWTSLGGSGGNLSAIRAFTSGTNVSYTPGDDVSRIVVEVWGGGGGGSASRYSGASGGTTCFGTSASACSSPIVSASGGGGAPGWGFGGAGGSGSGGDLNLTGGPGNIGGQYRVNGEEQRFSSGGSGGDAPRGGGGGAAPSSPYQGTAGSSFGGGGSGIQSDLGGIPSGGGGSGGYAMKLITSPASSYTYTIGAGGAGAGGMSYYGFYGGAGGSGGIVIYEYSK